MTASPKHSNGLANGLDASSAPQEAEPSDSSAPHPVPSLRVLGQYLKDLSFENPVAAQFSGDQGQPQLNVAVNVSVKPLSQPTDFEVELHLEAKASHQEKPVFMADVLYAGIFRIENVPKEALHPVVLIECPRMLFPFARQILADATRNGGFPPLMLDPIDFASMYQKRLRDSQESSSQAPSVV